MRLIVLSKMFNERDFLPVFVRHYVEQGCDEILLFDHRSSDGSAELAARLPRCRLLPWEASDSEYSYATDERLCNELLDFARRETTEPTWWLFPDLDELLRPKPRTDETLRSLLEALTEVDGVGCIGVHCLPVGSRDAELDSLPPEQFYERLDELLPPRSFEPTPRAGEAWKNIVWRFPVGDAENFKGMQFCAGSHVLVGDRPLKMWSECLVAYHYKVRSLERYCHRTRDVIARIPPLDPFRKVIGEKLQIVETWKRCNYRQLRLGPRLSHQQIRTQAEQTRGQGLHLVTPYPMTSPVQTN